MPSEEDEEAAVEDEAVGLSKSKSTRFRCSHLRVGLAPDEKEAAVSNEFVPPHHLWNSRLDVDYSVLVEARQARQALVNWLSRTTF